MITVQICPLNLKKNDDYVKELYVLYDVVDDVERIKKVI